ncbi:hypothetical protein KC19_VG321000 [Ceratodon purpureus]|uniref:Uncharacterized protein n=1 Tax=Ceratodon purpureus TaxID=3225 RepID=A0A8T0HWT7_CERPU|nr:hypothetical protein KC19_VG321000 [Ceratodon purpureus]
MISTLVSWVSQDISLCLLVWLSLPALSQLKAITCPISSSSFLDIKVSNALVITVSAVICLFLFITSMISSWKYFFAIPRASLRVNSVLTSRILSSKLPFISTEDSISNWSL